MLQILFLFVAIFLIITGIRALVGSEKPGKKTTTPTAIATIVVGVLLIGFALVGMPLLLAML